MADSEDEFDATVDDTEEEALDFDAAESSEPAESTDSKVDERVRALQSKADKAIAEKNKLEKELERLRKSSTAPDASKADVPDELKQWVLASQDTYRKQLFEGDPRLKEFGLSAERIQGTTPAEMRASATELSKFIDTMESSIRRQVQQEHGIAPLLSEGTPANSKSLESMSSDEFNAYFEDMMRRV